MTIAVFMNRYRLALLDSKLDENNPFGNTKPEQVVDCSVHEPTSTQCINQIFGAIGKQVSAGYAEVSDGDCKLAQLLRIKNGVGSCMAPLCVF